MLSVALKPLILPCVIYTFASIATPNSIWFCFVELTAAPAPASIHTQYSLFDLSNNLPCKFYVRIPMILRGSSFNFQLNVSICKPIFSTRFPCPRPDPYSFSAISIPPFSFDSNHFQYLFTFHSLYIPLFCWIVFVLRSYFDLELTFLRN